MQIAKRWTLAGLLMLLVAGATWALPAVAAAKLLTVEGRPGDVTALEVTAVGPPRYLFGSDGRTHVDYDLAITNAFTTTVTLKTLTIFGPRGQLLKLTGNGLAANTHQIIAGAPTAKVPASSTVITIVDVILPRSANRTPPARLVNRLQYTLPRNATFRAAIGSTTVRGPVLTVAKRAPVVIASPLNGPGWLAANGCCDPASVHRNLVLSANGSYVTPELYAIDWAQLVDGSVYTGDGSQLEDYHGFGRPIHAVADGTVVSTITDRPEVPPGASAAGNPTVRRPRDFGGNQIIERIGPGVYAAYEHLQTGSVAVVPGQRLTAGQPIAKLGNTGNTTFPHLHFGIQDGPDLLTSNALPFEIASFTRDGIVTAATGPNHITIAGPPVPLQRSHPLVNGVYSFGS